MLAMPATSSAGSKIIAPGDIVFTCAPRIIGQQPSTTLAIERVQQLCQNRADGLVGPQYETADIIREWSVNDFDVVGQSHAIKSTAIHPENGTIFAAAYRSYCGDWDVPTAGHIFRIDPVSGAVSLLVTLPGNSGLGYIEYDRTHNQLLAANPDDGKLYRIDPISGAVLQNYDPFLPDGGGDGFAALGERVLGITVSSDGSTVYFSTVNAESLHEVYQISLDANGAFVGAETIAITMPHRQPAADLQYHPTSDSLLIAEQGMAPSGCQDSPHDAWVTRWDLVAGIWVQSKRYEIGYFDAPSERNNAAGGIAWAYCGFDGCAPENYGDYLLASGNALLFENSPPGNQVRVYGYQFQSVLDEDVSLATLIDSTGVEPSPVSINNLWKGYLGDVDVYLPSTCSNDLALVATFPANSDVEPGSTVRFVLSITNQGNGYIANPQVVAYLPACLSPVDPLPQVGDGVLITLGQPLPSCSSRSYDIFLEVDEACAGGLLTAEFELFSSLPDLDSVSDSTLGNDAGGFPGSPADNAVDGDGTGAVGGPNPFTDEDDHDPVQFNVERYDLALQHTMAIPGAVGPNVPFDLVITVINQGTLPASFKVLEHLPAGLELVPGLNPDWSVSVFGPTSAVIGPLAGGASTNLILKVRIQQNFSQNSVVAIAEISQDDGLDPDSSPDFNRSNDAGGAVSTASDNAINGDGSGTPLSSSAATDEDDHDPVLIQIASYDLALKIETVVASAAAPGQPYTVRVTIENQGGTPANTAIAGITLPPGVSVSATNPLSWNGFSGGAMSPNFGPIPTNTSTSLDLILDVAPSLLGQSVVVIAEIVSDDGFDVDSTVDMIANNDAGGAVGSASDNSLTGDGSGAPGDLLASTDEDDHDPVLIVVGGFDLAITYTSLPSLSPGLITILFEIENLGTLDAHDIVVIHNIPPELTLTDPNWSLSGPDATFTYPGPLMSGDSISGVIRFTLPTGSTATSASITAQVDSASTTSGGTPVPESTLVNNITTATLVPSPVMPSIDVVTTLSINGTCPGINPVTLPANQIVTYCIEVINTGSVRVDQIAVDHPIISGFVMQDISLFPTESHLATVTFVPDGSEPLQATATGTGIAVTSDGTPIPGAPTATDSDSLTVQP